VKKAITVLFSAIIFVMAISLFSENVSSSNFEGYDSSILTDEINLQEIKNIHQNETGMELQQNISLLINENTEFTDVNEPISQINHFTGGEDFIKALAVDGLVKVVGIANVEGWVYARELRGEVPNNPEEALRQQQLRQELASENENNFIYINVYESDGVTIIGKFGVFILNEPLLYK